MDAERHRKRICKEVTCSICLGYFTNPVEVDCRHNFCETCILRCWKESGENTRCPECRTSVGDYMQNRLLKNMVGIIRDLDHCEEREAKRRHLECQRHQKTLDHFCRDDEAPFCGECDTSQGHSGHRVVPVAEAAQAYKGRLCRGLETLKEKKVKFQEKNACARHKCRDFLEKLVSDRQKMKDEFKELHEFLQEIENQLLEQLTEMETEITSQMNEQLAKISGELNWGIRNLALSG